MIMIIMIMEYKKKKQSVLTTSGEKEKKSVFLLRSRKNKVIFFYARILTDKKKNGKGINVLRNCRRISAVNCSRLSNSVSDSRRNMTSEGNSRTHRYVCVC